MRIFTNHSPHPIIKITVQKNAFNTSIQKKILKAENFHPSGFTENRVEFIYFPHLIPGSRKSNIAQNKLLCRILLYENELVRK
jgi:hypothetical protein